MEKKIILTLIVSLALIYGLVALVRKAPGEDVAKTAAPFDIKIEEVTEGKEFKFTSSNSKASGKFIVYKLQLTNISKGPAEFSKSTFRLTGGGQSYLVDDNSFSAAENMVSEETIFKHKGEYVGAYDKINPGISKHTFVVFDVPEDAKIENLKFDLK